MVQGITHRGTDALAYLGDAVFEVYLRSWLLAQKNVSAAAYNREAREYVSATAQAAMYHKILPHLSPEEAAVMRRGRNLHTSSKAKSALTRDYRHATGLEALFGHLYINGEPQRLADVFALCVDRGISE